MNQKNRELYCQLFDDKHDYKLNTEVVWVDDKEFSKFVCSKCGKVQLTKIEMMEEEDEWTRGCMGDGEWIQ